MITATAPTAATVTDAQIIALSADATDDGNALIVRLCALALGPAGSLRTNARGACARAIEYAAAEHAAASAEVTP